jgi:hypothetical protein
MVGRFTSKSEVVFGPPHTFGWVRCREVDANGLEGWERPDGTMARLPRGAQLVRPPRRARPAHSDAAGNADQVEGHYSRWIDPSRLFV